jgi:hypothetical protein
MAEVVDLLTNHPHLREELRVNVADISRTGVTCPVIQEEIVVPCELKSCAYHTDLPKCHGCAIVYSSMQGTEFQTLDLAILYRQPHEAVKRDMDRILTALKSSLKDGAEATFEFFPLPGVCSTCESPIEDDSPTLIEGCEYCSRECAEACPPASARAGYIHTSQPS